MTGGINAVASAKGYITKRTSTILRTDEPHQLAAGSNPCITSKQQQAEVQTAGGEDGVDSEVKALIVPNSATSSSEFKISNAGAASNRQFFTLQTQNVKFPITFEVAKVYRDPAAAATTTTVNTGTAMDASQLSHLTTDRRMSSLNRDLSPSCIGAARSPSKQVAAAASSGIKQRINLLNDRYHNRSLTTKQRRSNQPHDQNSDLQLLMISPRKIHVQASEEVVDTANQGHHRSVTEGNRCFP